MKDNADVNTGKPYEEFVKGLQTALFLTEKQGFLKNINIETRKKIIDSCGIEREFDLYWEYEVGGFVYKTVVECKDYNSAITVEKIDALVTKIRDVSDNLKAVFATKIGYQSGAEKKARQHGIELLVVRKPRDSDWVNEKGDAIIRSVEVSFQIGMPAIILNFKPLVDNGTYVNEDGKIDFVECTTDKLLINDGCQICSYHEMVNQLTLKHKNDIGVFEELVKFERSGELSTPSMKLKIFGYFVKYEIKKPEEITFTVDLSDYLYGVIEYLSKEQKTLFWLNGKITKVPLIEK